MNMIIQKLQNNIINMKTSDYFKSLVFSFTFVLGRFILYTLYPVTRFEQSGDEIANRIHDVFLVFYLSIFAFLILQLLIIMIQRRQRCLSMFVSVFITIPIAIYVVIIYGTEFLNDMLSMLIYLNLFYLAGYAMYKFDLIDTLTKRIETLAVFMFPAFLHYSYLMITRSNPYQDNTFLGIHTYQHVAITVLPLILALTVNFIRFPEYNLFGFINVRFKNIIRLILIALMWGAVIIPGGTRSIILGYSAFIILILLYAFFVKSNIKRTAVVAIVISGIMVFQIMIPLNQSSMGRLTFFFDELAEGNLTTTYNAFVLTEDIINNTIEAEKIESETNNTSQEQDDGPITEDRLGDRGNLFTLALAEGMNEPLSGLGPKGFEYKYGRYPHNIIMELISDFGIVWGVLITVVLAYFLVRNIIISKKNQNLGYTILFVMGYFVLMMSSQSLYSVSYPLFFGLGIGLQFIIKGKQVYKDNE